MDVLKDNPRKLYLRYLAASFGGCMIMTVYGLVDTLAIGRYEGPEGRRHPYGLKSPILVASPEDTGLSNKKVTSTRGAFFDLLGRNRPLFDKGNCILGRRFWKTILVAAFQSLRCNRKDAYFFTCSGIKEEKRRDLGHAVS